MATRVGLRQISLTPLNSPTPKKPWLVQESGTYLPQKLSYSHFSDIFQIFVTMATRVGLRQISLTHLSSPTPKNPYLVQELGTYLP